MLVSILKILRIAGKYMSFLYFIGGCTEMHRGFGFPRILLRFCLANVRKRMRDPGGGASCTGVHKVEAGVVQCHSMSNKDVCNNSVKLATMRYNLLGGNHGRTSNSVPSAPNPGRDSGGLWGTGEDSSTCAYGLRIRTTGVPGSGRK